MTGQDIFQNYERITDAMTERDIFNYSNDKRLFILQMLITDNEVHVNDIECLVIMIDAYIKNYTDFDCDN